MSKFWSTVNKIVHYVPIVRSVVDIVIGAVRGIYGVVHNPQVDSQQFMKDNGNSVKSTFVDSKRAEADFVDFMSNLYNEKDK